MSWILNNKKKVLFIIAYLFIIIVILLFGLLLHINCLIIFLLLCFITLACILNVFVYLKLRRQSEPFSPMSKIRNVDYLIIGDLININDYVFMKDKTYVQILAPDRGLKSSFEILKHTHSILKNKGTVVIAVDDNNDDFSLFDVIFFHPITIKKYYLEKMLVKSKLPLLFSPIRSIWFLIGKTKKYEQVICKNNELINFCNKREYSLIHLENIK